MVLVIGDVLTPGGGALGDGDVAHEMVVGRTVPVLVAVRRVVHVARTIHTSPVNHSAGPFVVGFLG